jgi:hypothetical protein
MSFFFKKVKKKKNQVWPMHVGPPKLAFLAWPFCFSFYFF